MRIAVVGGGVSGIVAAFLLQKNHDVTIFEKNDYLGGHTHTILIPDGPDAGTPVDTGFIVLNDRTYPLFRSFLERLGVPTRDTGMSFSFQCRKTGLFYSGKNLNGLFAQRSNLLRPAFWRMLAEIRRFSREGETALVEESVGDVTLGDYLRSRHYSPDLIDDYVIPMCSAIWSSPSAEIEGFPAAPLLRFFHNHGLLSLKDRPQWMTVQGGSKSYVTAFLNRFRGTVSLEAPVRGIARTPDGPVLMMPGGETIRFDKVVIATHADEALGLLEDPSPGETRLLAPWRYQDNHVILHTDTSVLPPARRAWACWNYTRENLQDGSSPVAVTYYMNMLQGLRTHGDYCVSLNLRGPVARNSVIAGMTYRHPVFSLKAMNTQPDLSRLNGERDTFFCGSYFANGFHEDAVRSASAVGRSFGEGL